VLGAGLAGVAAALVLAAIAPTHPVVPKANVAAGRILSAVVEPIVPTLGLAPQVRATEVLVARPDVRVEVFTQWSVR
jgi:predicted NAD/FAD-dependent oxidoreductase